MPFWLTAGTLDVLLTVKLGELCSDALMVNTSPARPGSAGAHCAAPPSPRKNMRNDTVEMLVPLIRTEPQAATLVAQLEAKAAAVLLI